MDIPPPILGGRKTELPLLGGKVYYAVIDVEALILGKVINIVEQVAFVLYSIDGAEVWAEKHMIYQPHTGEELSRMYGVDLETVQQSVNAYKRITGDEPVHSNPRIFERWSDVRRHIQKACHDHTATVYAKGISLETSVFYGTITFQDLAWFGCPRYPLPLHDPLKECRFFAQFIPEIRNRIYCYYGFWN
ncbi:MAG: hypothetical protein P4L69_07080 [Desulfosporosinus sp.]|nr:hypothetical protein [Desulfosporosinus sp.]